MVVTLSKKGYSNYTPSSVTYNEERGRLGGNRGDDYIARRAYLAAKRTGHPVKKVKINTYYD